MTASTKRKTPINTEIPDDLMTFTKNNSDSSHRYMGYPCHFSTSSPYWFRRMGSLLSESSNLIDAE